MKRHTIVFAAAALLGMSMLTVLSQPPAKRAHAAKAAAEAPKAAAVSAHPPAQLVITPRRHASAPAAVPTNADALKMFQPSETEAAKLERMLDENSTPEGTAPVEAMIANLDAHFADEQVDRAWSSERANFIRDTVKPFAHEGVDLRGVDCKTTMCRMDAAFGDGEMYRDYVAKVIHSGACRECIYLHVGDTPDGRPIVNMYMSREGHSLPRID